jgi:2-octaprenyl-6-methoxyphenol hydroxylase
MGRMSETLRADVVVAGGGPVGATLALALAHAGMDVALVDAGAPGGSPDGGRALFVAAAPYRMWSALGLGPALDAHAQPVRALAVETASRSGPSARATAGARLVVDGADGGAPGDPLGWLVEAAPVQAALAAALPAAGVSVLASARVADVRTEAATARVALDDGRTLHAPLVVGAEGRRSRVREAAGVGVARRDYGQTAVTATFALERPHEGVARQVFAPGGPLALLPLVGDRASLVWSAPDKEVQALLRLAPEAFAALVERRFGEATGRLRLLGARSAFPLSLQLADALTGPRTALAGDAAHAVHPIAGQGLNLGLKDAAALAEVVADARRLGEDWGAPAVLDRYARWRRFDRAALAAATDGFARGFSSPAGPLRALSGLALAAADALAPARRLFAREAAGALGDTPRLLRGEPA